MPWVLVDVAIALLSLIVLIAVGVSLWRRARLLTRALGSASERVSAAMPAPPVSRDEPGRRTT